MRGYLLMVNRWRKIEKEVVKAGVIPADINTPLGLNATWNVYVSDRSNGKTTSWLIYAIKAYDMYGIVTHYIRSSRTMITQSAVMTIFNVILSNNYITKLTHDKWNSICYMR